MILNGCTKKFTSLFIKMKEIFNCYVFSWVFNNLWSRWESIIRQHLGKSMCKMIPFFKHIVERTIVETLSAQLSGYGCKRSFIQQLCDNLNLAETSRLISSNSQFMTKLETWDEGLLHQFIDQFLAFRFPTIYVLNKIDLKSSPKNIEKIFNLYDQVGFIVYDHICNLA